MDKSVIDPPPPDDRDLPTLRTLGVLADIRWPRAPVRQGRDGVIACSACLDGADHETYRPVRIYRDLYRSYLALNEPELVIEHVETYGFPEDRHHDRFAFCYADESLWIN